MYMNSKLTNIIDKFLDGLVPYYIYTIIGVHVLYILLFIGFLNFNSSYLETLNSATQLFVCLFLMIKFNPYRKHEFREQDVTIIFGSATFLLLNLGFVKVFNNYFANIPIKIINETKDKLINIHP